MSPKAVSRPGCAAWQSDEASDPLSVCPMLIGVAEARQVGDAGCEMANCWPPMSTKARRGPAFPGLAATVEPTEPLPVPASPVTATHDAPSATPHWQFDVTLTVPVPPATGTLFDVGVMA